MKVMAALAPIAQVLLRDILWTAVYEAGGPGFEPRQADPESAVLPLHHPPIKKGYYTDLKRDSHIFEITFEIWQEAECNAPH